MAVIFVIIVVIVQIFLSLVHLFVWNALASAFALENVAPLRILFMVLSLTFVPASVLASRYSNSFVRKFYAASAYWLAAAYFLFLGALVFFSGVAVSRLFAFYFSLRIWGAIVFGISIIVYLYGVFHAHDVEITRFSVKLQNLPDLWKGKHVVFMSDLHLGNVRGKKFAGKISSLIQTLKPETVLIGGDLYDGVAADLDNLISPLRSISAPRGIYFITGNHEEFGDKTKYIEAVKRAGIRVLDNEKTELDGLQLIGVDYMETTRRKRFAEIIDKLGIVKDRPSILLKHEPTKLDIAERAGISLMLSGHTHQGQMFPVNLVSRLVYGRHYHGLGKLGNMAIYTSSGTGTWGPPTRFGTKSEIVVIELA